MWSLSDELLKSLRQMTKEPSLQLQLSEDFGSQNPDYRENLRKALPKNSSHSISHTQGLGGFASVDSKKQVGFDIEAASRVTSQVAERVSFSDAEFLAAPTPAQLWVAKESAFKSLRGPLQPQVIASIEVGSWASLPGESNFETFRIETPKEARNADSIGVTFMHKGFIFGVFVLSPLFLP